MKMVIQRVKKARVTLVPNQKVVGEIMEGLFVLVGFKNGDTEKEIEMLAEKLSKLRVMKDEEEKMNLSVKDTDAGMLVVSQFTLYAGTQGGNRPSFIEAEEAVRARELYDFFIKKLREKDIKIETGSFGECMQIETVLDGPVTIIYSD